METIQRFFQEEFLVVVVAAVEYSAAVAVAEPKIQTTTEIATKHLKEFFTLPSSDFSTGPLGL